MRPAILKSRYKNKLEASYAERLELLKRGGEILDWKYEVIGLRLADGAHYYPDFMVIQPEAFEFHETKASFVRSGREKGVVKFRVAKEMFPWFKWVFVTRERGEWRFR